MIFTPIFEDADKMCVLEMHKGLQHSLVATCLVDNIILRTDEEKLNTMTCSKLNQFAGDA